MIVTDTQQIIKIVSEAKKRPKVYLDTETDGVTPFKGSLLCGISMHLPGTGNERQSYYFPYRHRVGKNADIKSLPVFNELLAATASAWWNAPFDCHILRNDGIVPTNRIVDAQLGVHLCNENLKHRTAFRLKDTAALLVDPSAADEESELLQMIGGKDKIAYAPPETVYRYAERDVELTCDMDLWARKRAGDEGLLTIYDELSDYVVATIEMEQNGLKIDRKGVEEQVERVGRKGEGKIRDQYWKQLAELVGVPDFNPNSHVQCKKLFGLPLKAKCDKDWLEQNGSEEALMIRRARQYDKIVSSFFDPMLVHADNEDKIHPSVQLWGTVSGRPSCGGGINLMALPREDDFFNVRSQIIAHDPDHTLVSFDWSQAELRLLTHYTRDPKLTEVYMNNGDVHGMTAKLLSIDRDWAKRLNFGAVYGLGADGFSLQARISKPKAASVLYNFHSAYPTIKRLYRKAEQIAKTQKYIKMWTGRRRRFEETWECRKAMSGLIQGGVGEIMRHTIVPMRKHICGSGIKMLIQIYDDLLFDVPNDLLVDFLVDGKRIMEDHAFRVPIISEPKYGTRWGQMKKHE